MKIEEKNLQEIESLLTQSLNGIHLLFDNDEVAKVLSTPTEDLDFFNFEQMDRIQNLFTELIQQDSFYGKQRYLQSLDPESYEILLRTYFHILDNTALAATNNRH